MIASGEKKEEYREIKEYYETRFQNLFGAITIYPSSIFSERYEYELLQGNDVPEEIRQDRVQEKFFVMDILRILLSLNVNAYYD